MSTPEEEKPYSIEPYVRLNETQIRAEPLPNIGTITFTPINGDFLQQITGSPTLTTSSDSQISLELLDEESAQIVEQFVENYRWIWECASAQITTRQRAFFRETAVFLVDSLKLLQAAPDIELDASHELHMGGRLYLLAAKEYPDRSEAILTIEIHNHYPDETHYAKAPPELRGVVEAFLRDPRTETPRFPWVKGEPRHRRVECMFNL